MKDDRLVFVDVVHEEHAVAERGEARFHLRSTEFGARLDGSARVLVRPSGTEPVVRLLAEAPTEVEAQELSDTIVALVRRELG